MTIVDVAKLANVSHSTVSRVINGRKGISEETAENVRKAMNAVGYVPLPAEKRRGPRLSKKDRNTHVRSVAIVWSQNETVLTTTNFNHVFEGVIGALTLNGINPVLCNTSENGALYRGLKKEVRDKIDGVVMLSTVKSESLFKDFSDLPFIWTYSQHTKSGDHVVGGNETVGQMAAKYLIERGHTELAFLNGFPDHPAIRARGEGFRFAAFNHDREAIMLTEEHNRFSTIRPRTLGDIEIALRPLVEQYVKMDFKPTGIFIPQDCMTAVAYKLLNQAGIKPGRDVTIVSADNELPWLAGLDPRPATIDIGSKSLGQHAVEQLLWRIKNPNNKRQVQVTIEPKLIDGEQLK